MSVNIPVGEPTFSIGTTAVDVLKENPGRHYAILVNDSDTAIYLSFAKAAVVNTGLRLAANGGNYEINSTNLWKGRMSAISSAASKTLTVVEW